MTAKSEGMRIPGKLKWYAILALALWLAFSGVAAAEQLYVNESSWWREGDAFNVSETPIQAAVDNATAGDSIFVYNGTYYEDGGVSISKERITLQGEDASTTTIQGRWTGEYDKVVHVTGDYVNVSGFTVTGRDFSGESGIYVNADYCTISDNDASENYWGILLYSSNNCVLENNTANSNVGCGIYLAYSSDYCVLKNNIASSYWGDGIQLHSSNYCVLENNTVNSNSRGIVLFSSSNYCVLENNIANSNDYYGIILSSSSNYCVLKNNTANSNGDNGIRLWGSSNNLITGNTFGANGNGIYLVSTSINNNIKENTVSGNDYGMYLDGSGDNEIYHNNFINNNKQAYDHNGFNSWDKGASVGGNHWSDHSCSGNPSDGTEPYTEIDTDAGAVDNYPFENQDGWVSSITNLHNTSYEQTYINWTWTDPVNESFSKVMVYLDGIFQANVTKGVQCYNATGLAPDTEHTISMRTVDTAGNIDESWINHTAGTKPIPDTTAPASITSLDNATSEQTYISWTWTDPADADFSKVMVYLDGIYKEDVLKGVQCYNATGLTADTEHEIATRTVDNAGNINATWVNDTARVTEVNDTARVTEVKIAASDGAEDDHFGVSVAISGDYAVVGAYADDDAGTSSGSAYIFKRDGTAWTEEAKIAASDGAAGDEFGASVAISGDYAVMGADHDDDSGPASGSAYIFKRDGTAWTEQGKITASDAAANDRFGASVAISGDYAVVGAYQGDGAVSDSGSAYIFKRDGTTWTEQGKITASDAAANDQFGKSVAISGDYAVVGARQDDDAGTYSGSAYIFWYNGTAWIEQDKITASDAVAWDRFGYRVAISGDYAIVGVYEDDLGGESDSAHIFKRDGTAWTEQAKITASDGAAHDLFGASVAISGDYAVVGARQDDDAGSYSGSAYIFKRDGAAWTEQAKITASDAAENDLFGYSVAISGGYAIVGAHGDNDAGTGSGSAYIYTICAPPPLNITSFAPSSPVADTEGAARAFSITVNQTANVSWLINGTEVQTNESVTSAAYTNASAAPGIWNVSAIASNTNGTAMQTWWWTVLANTPPTASFTFSPSYPFVGHLVTFNGSDSSDPDGFITSYEWNFGDGNISTGMVVAHSYSSAGTYAATLEVTDNGERTGTKTIDVQYGERPTRGDVNGDGYITSSDAAIALQIAAGSRPCDATTLDAADVNGDGSVTSLDALMILQAAGGA